MQKIFSIAAAALVLVLLLNSHVLAVGEAGVPSLIIPPGARPKRYGR